MFNIYEIFGKKYTFVVDSEELAPVTSYICKRYKLCKISKYAIDGYYKLTVRSDWYAIERLFGLLKEDGYVLNVMNSDMHMHVTKKERG